MAVRVAINGFGRIGRLVYRALIESGRTDIEVVAINDLADTKTNAHLLKYDSVHGRFGGTVAAEADHLLVNGKKLMAVQVADPAKLPWGDMKIDVALECSGRFTKRDDAAKHIAAGAKKVLISAPATDEDITVVYGINHGKLKAEHTIVSNASCTTNCLAPVAHVLHQAVGISHGFMTTIHSYTGDQRVVDTMHSDLHRARAAALSMIPTTTGAAKAVGKVLPELKGKLDGHAVRAPVLNASLTDCVFELERPTTAAEVNALFEAAARGPLAGILGFEPRPLVSIDYQRDTRSAIVDGLSTLVTDGTMLKVYAWYDNEMGYACRMVDLACHLEQAGI